jgi:hypothetical protein
VGVGLVRFRVSATANPSPTGNVPQDFQIVPVLISPLAPTGIDLLDAWDTGAKTQDNITRLNNADSSSRLRFLVSGTVNGATVELFSENSLIGQATASGTTTEVETNGSLVLAAGLHSIVARQTLRNVPINPAQAGLPDGITGLARRDSVNLASADSAPLAVRVAADWQNPVLVFDVDGDGTVAPIDAHLILNELNANDSHPLPPNPSETRPYLDVDGDNNVAPIDAHRVINQLNDQVGSGSSLSALSLESEENTASAGIALAPAAVDSVFESLLSRKGRLRRG